jgi:hypothetical protein
MRFADASVVSLPQLFVALVTFCHNHNMQPVAPVPRLSSYEIELLTTSNDIEIRLHHRNLQMP